MNAALPTLLHRVPTSGVVAVSRFGGSGKSSLAAGSGRFLAAPAGGNFADVICDNRVTSV